MRRRVAADAYSLLTDDLGLDLGSIQMLLQLRRRGLHLTHLLLRLTDLGMNVLHSRFVLFTLLTVVRKDPKEAR